MARTLLRLPEVIRRTGSSTTDIYGGMRAGTFPASVPIGERTVGWVDTEIDKWIEQRIKARDDKARDVKPAQRRGGPGRGHKGPMTEDRILRE